MNEPFDGLARVQSESRISASTWRQWCEHLPLSPALAVELWDEVCHPMMLASGQAPDIALLLQLRAARSQAVLDDFRDELPAVLLTLAFLDGVLTEPATQRRAALLRLYRFLGSATHDPVGRAFVAHAGSLALLDGVLPRELTVGRLVKVLCVGKSSLRDLIDLGRRALRHDDRRDAVEEALDAALDLLEPPPSDGPDPEEDDPEDDDPEETPTGAVPDPVADFVHAFRAAAAAVFAPDDDDDDETRRRRLQVIQAFHPFASRIPTMEEARHMSEAAGGGSAAGRSGGTGRATPAAPSRAGGGGGRGRALSARRGSGGRLGSVTVLRADQLPRAASLTAPPAVQVGGADAVSLADQAPPTPLAPDVDDSGKLPVPAIGRHELTASVAAVSTSLRRLQELDPRLWALFVDADHTLESARMLADELVLPDSPAERAAAALRVAAQQQRLRSILALPADRRMKERRFDLEVEAWLNAVAHQRRDLDVDSRQLIPLPRVLDRTAAALIRVEALRAAIAVAHEAAGGEVSVESVTQRYEALLSNVSYLADGAVLAAARQRADADAAEVLAAVAADTWVTRVREAAFGWLDSALAAGAADSVAAMEAALESSPLVLEPPAEAAASGPPTGELPAALEADTAFGEIVDGLRRHVLRVVRTVLAEAHRPERTLRLFDSELKRRLRAYARIAVRRERHARNPRVALPVVSLERLSGNPELASLFVRLSPDGRLQFLPDYEDGSYIDLYELRESQRRQMQARAQQRAADGAAATQTGASYLHTLGRTNTPFATTREGVLAGCVTDDEGKPVIFDPA